ncbi:MAG: flgG [Firmicutes bacterium]|nr:flgG [Bacillota bacterium]
MNMSFYTAAVGASQQQKRMNVVANNIANVNTYGYKAEKPSFAALMYGNVTGIDEQNLPRGTGARLISADTDFGAMGPVADTGRSLDYAILGRGFFALKDPTTGEISYTRDGSFTMSGYQLPNEEGTLTQVFMLSDGEGRFVLDESGAPIEITDSQEKQSVAVYDFVHTDGMNPIGANRYLPVEKNGEPYLVANPVVVQGSLEASSTDLATEMAKVIEAQRSFSYALRMVQTSDEVTTTINGLRG